MFTLDVSVVPKISYPALGGLRVSSPDVLLSVDFEAVEVVTKLDGFALVKYTMSASNSLVDGQDMIQLNYDGNQTDAQLLVIAETQLKQQWAIDSN
ncbi:hypothetical protein ACN4GA_08305 [Raoultella terrigena]